MCKDVLKGIGELERVNVSKTELDMGVDDKLGEAQNFSAQVEGISETRLFTFLRGEGPERF